MAPSGAPPALMSLMGGGGPGGGGGGGPGGGSGDGINAIALAQAFQTRMAALSSVAASLLGKREAVTHALTRVQARMGEVSAARNTIENETVADTEAILHKLRSAEAAKLAVLQADADALSTDVAAIDNFYTALQSYQPATAPGEGVAGGAGTGAGGGGAASALAGAIPASYDTRQALEFMRVYPELCAEADRLAAKSVKSEVDVRADDFERETAVRLGVVSRFNALVELVAAKDRIILQMLKEREGLTAERDAALDEAGALRGATDALRLDAAASAADRTAMGERIKALEGELARAQREASAASLIAASGSPGRRRAGGDDSLAPTDVEHWIRYVWCCWRELIQCPPAHDTATSPHPHHTHTRRLTEQLTSELNDLTGRLGQLQAAAAVAPPAGHTGRGHLPLALSSSGGGSGGATRYLAPSGITRPSPPPTPPGGGGSAPLPRAVRGSGTAAANPELSDFLYKRASEAAANTRGRASDASTTSAAAAAAVAAAFPAAGGAVPAAPGAAPPPPLPAGDGSSAFAPVHEA